MKKNLLFERFQKLAGIKSLNENTVSLNKKEFEEFEEQYEQDGKILRNFYKNGSGDKDDIKKAHEQLHMYLNDGVPDFDYDKNIDPITGRVVMVSMAQKELEEPLKQLFPKGNEYELDEETTPIIGNNSHNTTSTPLIKALYSVNTYELESNIKDYLLEVYKEEGFGKATDKMVAIERALDQARDSFNKADFSS